MVGFSKKNKKAQTRTVVEQTKHVDSPPMSEANKALLLKFAMIAPVLVFVDQALAHSEVSSFQRTIYQLMCVSILYLIIAPTSESKPGPTSSANIELLAKRGRANTIVAGNGGVFWKVLPGERTISAPSAEVRGMLASPKHFGEFPVDPLEDMVVPPSVMDVNDAVRRRAGERTSKQRNAPSISASSVQSSSTAESVPPVTVPTMREGVKAVSSSVAPVAEVPIVETGNSQAPEAAPMPINATPTPRPIPPPLVLPGKSPVITPPATPRSATLSPSSRPFSESPSQTETSRVISDASSLSTSGLPLHYERDIEMMIKTTLHLVNDKVQWNERREAGTSTGYQLMQHKSIPEAWRFDVEVKASLETAFQFLMDPASRQKWDDMTQKAQTLRIFTTTHREVSRIQYYRTKGVFPAVPRDMVVLYHAQRLGDGRAVIVQRSVQWDWETIQADGVKGIISDVNICGTIIESVGNSDDQPRCRLTHIHDVNYHVNLATSVSEFMTTMIAPRAVKRLVEELEKMEEQADDAVSVIESYQDDEEESSTQNPELTIGASATKKRWSPAPRISLPLTPAFESMVSPLVSAALQTAEDSTTDNAILKDIKVDEKSTAHRYAEDIDAMLADVFEHMEDESRWEQVSKDGHASVYINTSDSAFKFKVVAEMTGPLEAVFETLTSLPTRPSWDPSCKSSRCIEYIDDHTSIHHAVFAEGEGNPGQELESVVLSHSRRMERKGGLVGLLWRVAKDENGEGDLSGIVCEPHPTHASKCILTHLLSSPASSGQSADAVVRYVASKTLPAAVRRLQEVVADRLKKGKWSRTSAGGSIR
ncbi:uncharacterized protein SPPG_05140 [Spizellomyces punctatus DAOM BR117]|uniref:START domain-containing protein n=1 Tax=Spizellomyces punctatus (strain DAOM BR117) TaxID=645134 RepID=A0A0L0HG36_SPIPD|nr:uncharacterized protein SPPG_05140 [Spizellomyces punctatus DAOM BR117]KNC99763.1 hypothetical protein SPPG_05140 [Spizellomyces punctatus DAOM BR117]|eukprot:XP_016607803.1 hypothetical protein SPPG_05140 [Spizellomyces punctatus DAOM BR117]